MTTGDELRSLLRGDQAAVASHFARGTPPIALWSGVETRTGETGAPLLADALAWLECRVWADYDVGEQLAHERGGRWHERAQADMMGMSSPEWSRYMHDVIGLAEPPEEINAEIVRRLLVRYRTSLPLLPGAVEAVERM